MEDYCNNDPNIRRKDLPIYKVRQHLLNQIKKNSVLIIIGYTGSGKTTLIPQFIHEDELFSNEIIAVTQPNRVAAISKADLVKTEICSTSEETVGYTVPFENTTSDNTKIKYLTGDILMLEFFRDIHLSNYGIVILDEVHEKSVYMDIIFGLIKSAHYHRLNNDGLKKLKIIILSTITDVDYLSIYFDNAPVILLETNKFPVKIYHSVNAEENYFDSALKIILEIHCLAPVTDNILVFLTDQIEIETMAEIIKTSLKDNSQLSDSPKAKIFSLYNSNSYYKIPSSVFWSLKNSRKIILCTNFAASSISIRNIKYVIDTGLLKIEIFELTAGLEIFKKQKISKEQASQRTNHVGMYDEGYCYRLYTSADYEEMANSDTSKCNLSRSVLQLLSLNVNPEKFEFIDKPSKDSLSYAYRQLRYLDAVINVNDNYQLTKTGKAMSAFPLDLKFSKVLLTSDNFECLREMSSTISLLFVLSNEESVFVKPQNKMTRFAECRLKFNSSAGDIITLINIVDALTAENDKWTFCRDNFLNADLLRYANEVRHILLQMYSAEFEKITYLDVSSCGNNRDKIRKCLITGFYANTAKLQNDGNYVTLVGSLMVNIHPASVLYNTFSPLLLYVELVQIGESYYMRHVTPIEKEWLMDIAPKEFLSTITL